MDECKAPTTRRRSARTAAPAAGEPISYAEELRTAFKPVAATRKGNQRITTLLRISREILTTQGLAELTLRNVARSAGMRLFNLQHYFPTQADLLRAAIVETITGFEEATSTYLSQARTNSPTAAFTETCRYYLQMNRQREIRTLFFDLGSLAQRDRIVANMLSEAYMPYRARFERLIAQLAPDADTAECSRRANFITAALEGTMYLLEPTDGCNTDKEDVETSFLSYLLQIASR